MNETISQMEKALNEMDAALTQMRQHLSRSLQTSCIRRGCTSCGDPKKMRIGGGFHLVTVHVCSRHWEKMKHQKRFSVQSWKNRVRWVMDVPPVPET